jgi:hypothetical protein
VSEFLVASVLPSAPKKRNSTKPRNSVKQSPFAGIEDDEGDSDSQDEGPDTVEADTDLMIILKM